MASLTSTPPPISSNAIGDDKNSGKLIIKAQLGDDIRKMMIHNEDLTLNELVLMMERVFSGKISNSDELTIKYLDDDGDKITLLNDSDLTVALHFHKLLRLFVFVNGNDLTNTNTTDNANKEGDLVDAKTFRNELQQIRNSVQTILDRLQLSTNEVQQQPTSKTETPATPPVASGATRFYVDVSYDVFKALFYAAYRSWKLRCCRTLNSFYNSLYPGHPLRGIACCGIVAGLYFKGHDPSYQAIDWLESNLFRRYLEPRNGKVLACLVVGSGVYVVLIQLRQYILKKLFSYHGWMYQEHGKDAGIMPKIWSGLVKLCVGRNPSLFSCQNFLPSLPVPSLDETLQRYLRSVRPLYDDAEYQRMEKLAEEFKQTIGKRLQRYLWLKWFISTNYVSDWWEKFIYLRGRSAIMVNSNFYGLDAIYIRPTTIQTARAANLTCAAFRYRTELDHENIKPLMVQKLVPLCTSQYERQFNTIRIPGKETDKIVHYANSHHIAVYHKGRWYKVFMFYKDHLLEPCELQLQLDEIIRDPTQPAYGEEHLAALTAGERTLWAEARDTYFRSGGNRYSLEAIEKAAFVLVLDEEEFEIGT
ncbi:unnamed protein product, partial [Rotaria magnacalcarata]